MSQKFKDAFKGKTPTEQAILALELLEVAMTERNQFEEAFKKANEVVDTTSNVNNYKDELFATAVHLKAVKIKKEIVEILKDL